MVRKIIAGIIDLNPLPTEVKPKPKQSMRLQNKIWQNQSLVPRSEYRNGMSSPTWTFEVTVKTLILHTQKRGGKKYYYFAIFFLSFWTATCGRLFVEPSGPSLKGKTEYETDSPSFLGSKGLFGLAGIPTVRNTKEELLNFHTGHFFLVTHAHFLLPLSKISFTLLLLRFRFLNSLSKFPRLVVYWSQAISGSWTTLWGNGRPISTWKNKNEK